MQVSNLEIDVWDIAIKGYRYDQEKNMVVPVISFSQEEKQRVYAKKVLFGFQSNDEIDRAINNILHQRISGEHFVDLSLSQINPGSKITIIGEYGRKIDLLYIDKLSFYVLKDDLNTLQPSDVIELLGGGFSVGKEVVFRVIRNGDYYPSAKHVFDMKVIKSLICLFPHPKNRVSSKQKMIWAKTKSKIFAWSASLLSESGLLAFPLNEFTDNQCALFLIDLVTGTYSINPNCDVRIYAQHGINWLEKMSMVSVFDNSKVIHWNTITNSLPGICGRLSYQPGREYVFIDSKIILSL